MKQKIIVLGATGMLGSVVSKYLTIKDYDVKALSSKDIDLEEPDAIFKLEGMIEKDTACIINCAGIIKPRISSVYLEEKELDPVFSVNSAFPIKMASMVNALRIREYQVKLIHISTDCVFTGDSPGKYQTEDIPDASDTYGLSKFLGEACKSSGMVIRTSIIGEEKRNKYSLLEWMKSMKGDHVHGWTDHTWSGVTTLQLAKYIEDLIYKNTIYNVLVQYASEPINKYELLCLINKVYDLNIDVHADEGGQICDRSLQLDTFGATKITDLETQLIELKKFFEVHMNGNV